MRCLGKKACSAPTRSPLDGAPGNTRKFPIFPFPISFSSFLGYTCPPFSGATLGGLAPPPPSQRTEVAHGSFFLLSSQLYKVNCPPSEYLWEHLGLLPKQPLLHAHVCSWNPCEVGGGVCCRKRPLPPSTGQLSGIFLLLPSQKHVTQPLPIFLARLGLAAAGSTAFPLPRAHQSPVLRPASGLGPLVSHCSSRPGGLHPCLEMRFPLKLPCRSLPGVLLPVDLQLLCRLHPLGVGPDWILNVCVSPIVVQPLTWLGG